MSNLLLCSTFIHPGSPLIFESLFWMAHTDTLPPFLCFLLCSPSLLSGATQVISLPHIKGRLEEKELSPVLTVLDDLSLDGSLVVQFSWLAFFSLCCLLSVQGGKLWFPATHCWPAQISSVCYIHFGFQTFIILALFAHKHLLYFCL